MPTNYKFFSLSIWENASFEYLETLKKSDKKILEYYFILFKAQKRSFNISFRKSNLVSVTTIGRKLKQTKHH
jgi:hypothetical protein